MTITLKIIDGWDDSTVLADLNDVTAPDSSGIMLRPGWVPKIASPAPQQLGTRFPWTNEMENIPLTVWGTSTSDVWQNIQELNETMDLARLHFQGVRSGFINFYYKPHGTTIAGVTCALILPQMNSAVEWDQQIHGSSRAYYADIWLRLPREGIYMLDGDAPLAADADSFLAGTAVGDIAWTTNPKTAANFQVPAPIRIRVRGFVPGGGDDFISVGEGYFIWTSNTTGGIQFIEAAGWDSVNESSGADGSISQNYAVSIPTFRQPVPANITRIYSPADDDGFDITPPIYWMDYTMASSLYNSHRLAIFVQYAVDPTLVTGKTTAFRAWAGAGRPGGASVVVRFPEMTPARILTQDTIGNTTGDGWNKVAFLGIIKPQKSPTLRLAIQKLVPENEGELWIVRTIIMALPETETYGWVRNTQSFLDYPPGGGNNKLDLWFDSRFEEGEFPQAFVTGQGSNPAETTQGDREFPDFYLHTQGRVAPLVDESNLKCAWLGGLGTNMVPTNDDATPVQLTLTVDADSPDGAFLVVP